MNRIILTFLALILPNLCHAQDSFEDRALEITRSCIAGSPDPVAWDICIGNAAETCQASVPGGQSNLGSAQCYGAELHAWDVLLNEIYGRARHLAKVLDEQEPEGSTDTKQRAETLRDAQRAWIALRDSECAFERAKWGGGSMGIPISAACLMDMTAHRVVDLENKRRDLENFLP